MKSYIVMSEWLGGAAPLGVFTSLELAQKEAKKWCENHSDEWEEHVLAGGGEPSRCINITECGEWWISIRKFEVNRLEIEE